METSPGLYTTKLRDAAEQWKITANQARVRLASGTEPAEPILRALWQALLDIYKVTARKTLGVKRTKRSNQPRPPEWATTNSSTDPREFGINRKEGPPAQLSLEAKLLAHSDKMWSLSGPSEASKGWELIKFLRARGSRTETGKSQLSQSEAVAFHKEKFAQMEPGPPEAREWITDLEEAVKKVVDRGKPLRERWGHLVVGKGANVPAVDVSTGPFANLSRMPRSGQHYRNETRRESTVRYAAYIAGSNSLVARVKQELKGKILTCAEAPGLCHAHPCAC